MQQSRLQCIFRHTTRGLSRDVGEAFAIWRALFGEGGGGGRREKCSCGGIGNADYDCLVVLKPKH